MMPNMPAPAAPVGMPGVAPAGPAGPSLAAQAQQSKAAGPQFQKPDLSGAIPAELKDTVDRIVAAGMKIMYSPKMADERKKAIEGPEPVAKKLSDTAAGLTLMLDRQSKGGLPPQAVFPAGLELMGDAADFMVQAGVPVTQEDYNDAARMLFTIMGQKMGGTPEQIMQIAQQAVPATGDNEGPGEDAQEVGPEGGPADMPAAAPAY